MEIVDIIVSLLTLVMLEIVLGIDNLVFVSILTKRLPRATRKRASRFGITFAWMTRLLLLASAYYLAKLTKPILHVFDTSFSFRDMFLIIGGLFLLTKATQEIHNEVAGKDDQIASTRTNPSRKFWIVVLQIGLLDIVFSLDSVLTAIGMSNSYWVMAAAITTSSLVMVYASNTASAIIQKYPSLRILSLSFLLLIGFVLIADGWSFQIPRGYIYFAMAFSLTVELLNIWRHATRGDDTKEQCNERN